MSVQAIPRDYSLSGGHQDAVELDNDRIVEKMEETWWKPKLSRQQMREIMQRRDGPALRHYGLWFVLLAASAYLAVISWGSWWAIPAFLIYGTIYSSSDAGWHECGHGTPFRTHWLNELLYHVNSFMTMREAYMWRWSHSRHHTHTYIVGRDPEIQVQRPADLLKIAMDFFYLRSGPPEVWRVVRNAFARPNSDVLDFMPERELPKMYWSSRIYLAIIAAFAVWSIVIGSFLPMMFVLLPRFYGGWLHQLLGLTQHAGLGEDTYDHRENTRTVFVNPVFAYLYMNMQYHIEHHSMPMTPFHALPKLHEAVKDQMPPPYRSLWACYREMIPALIKQATGDPGYQIMRPIPQEAESETAETPAIAESSGEWVEVCPVEDLEEEDVIRLDHGSRTLAVYRLKGDRFYATDGLCTHEYAYLADGLVIEDVIECPLHNGRFDITTGRALRAPACDHLETYPVERRGNTLFVRVA
ncbi:MAG: Rieske 2Fe-2S domain-containing protein [Caldilineaceae bacterium SB0661_bin_32]|uniref:Rieske 2Fe-2S domain-containing protein n=1 Tax=Caldilineaceae bacterium SB0661_bin_32 TaxID=2605255 RepID=A0A6B1DBE2_9CHLR|nr:Rieske 2Fe-2S domain-containing protein [Caldilineaceae bacterium SB0661_bin_32]